MSTGREETHHASVLKSKQLPNLALQLFAKMSSLTALLVPVFNPRLSLKKPTTLQSPSTYFSRSPRPSLNRSVRLPFPFSFPCFDFDFYSNETLKWFLLMVFLLIIAITISAVIVMEIG